MKYSKSRNKPGGRYKCKNCGGRVVAVYPDQQVCSFSCAISFYDQLSNKGRRTAKAVAAMVGRKSLAEVQFEVDHEDWDHEYETETWTYIPSVKKSKYTPDFIFPKKSGGYMYIEFKGKLDLATRKKLVDIKDQHPDKDLRLIFKKPQNKISKRSKTTYLDWAVKEGFKVSESDGMPEEWLEEVK